MESSMMLKFAYALLKSRWMVVVVSFYILACSGATYIFGIYSDSIKFSLKYHQETLNTLSFFKDLGANVGIIAGLVNEVTPPWFVLAVGAGMNLFGYLMIWFAVTRRIARPALWQMYLYICIGANSQTFANTGVMVTCVKNFPKSRGIVIGLLKGFVGLSGAIFTQVYLAIYGNNPSSLILLIAWFPALISLGFMSFIRIMPSTSEANESRNFYLFLYLALFLAGFLMLVIIVNNVVSVPQAGHRAIGVLVFLLICLNVGVAVQHELRKFKVQPEKKREAIISNFNPKAASVVNGNYGAIKDRISDGVIDGIPETNFVQGQNNVTNGIPSQKTEQTSGETLATSRSVLETEQAISLPTTDAYQTAGITDSTAKTDSEDYFQNRERVRSLHQDDVPKASPRQNRVELSSMKSLQAAESCSDPTGDYTQNAEKIGNRKGLLSFKWWSGSKWPKRGDDYTIPQALVSLDMWILFISTTCGIGATLTAIDNMGQIGSSLGYSRGKIATFVSLISIWNFLGRVAAGFLSEILLQKYRFPRPLMLTIVLALACVAHLLIASAFPGALYAASILIGLCFGAQWPMLYAVISELFGLRYFATLYNFGGVSSPVGMYVLSVKVAGYLYDKEARRQSAERLRSGAMSSTTSDLVCHGASCYRLTFLIMAGVSLFGSMVSAILVWRTKEFYKQDIYAKFVEENGKEDANK